MVIFYFLFLSMLPIFSFSFAFDANVKGTCGEFTITLHGNETGCWGVKIDADGRVFDGGWKSSFYYIEDGYCDGFGEIKFRSPERETMALIKLRQNNTMIEKGLDLAQDCDESREILVTVVVILLFVLAIAARLAILPVKHKMPFPFHLNFINIYVQPA